MDSVAVSSMAVVLLFIVAPIVCGGFVLGPYFVVQYLVSFLNLKSRAGCLTLVILFLMSLDLLFCVSSSLGVAFPIIHIFWTHRQCSTEITDFYV